MKKVLCYLAIILLIIVILTPPLLRIFYKEKEEVEVVKDEYYLLTCIKENYKIMESYKNNNALSIKFERPLVDSNLDTYTDNYSLEYTLDSELKNIINANTVGEGDNQVINYLLQFNNTNDDKLSKLESFRLPLENQITHYEAYGYTCNKIEQ